MSKEIISNNTSVEERTGWESMAEMAEGGAGKGMESLADEPSFEEHMAGKGGEKKTGGFFGGMREKLASMVHEERVKRQEAKIREFSGKEGGSYKIQELVRKGKIDLSEGRIIETYIDTFVDNASNYEVSELMRLGVPIETIANNKHMREMTAGAFKEIVDDVIKRQGEDNWSGGRDSISGLEYLKVKDDRKDYYGNKQDDTSLGKLGFSIELLKKMAEDEEGRKQLVEGVDLKQFGDVLVNGTLSGLGFAVLDDVFVGRPETILDVYKENLKLLKKLGYEPRFGEEGMDLGLLVDENSLDLKPFSVLERSRYIRQMQENAQRIGLIDENTVDAMYEYKKKKLAEYAKDPSDSAEMPEIIISGSLETSEHNEYARKMKKYTSEFGVDAMAFIANRVREAYKWDMEKASENGEEMYDFEELYDDGELGPKFFENTRIIRLAFRGEERFEAGECIRRLYADNLDKFSDIDGCDHLVGAIKAWDKIRDEDGHPDMELRESFMEFVSRYYSDRDMMHFIGDDKFETIFDKDGPTDKFYDELLMYSMSNCDFVERIDEGWQSHYNPAEVAFFDFKKSDLYKILSVNGLFYGGRETINNYFDGDGPNENMIDRCIERFPTIIANYPELYLKKSDGAKCLADVLFGQGAIYELVSHEELIGTLNGPERQYCEFMKGYKPQALLKISREEISNYFDDGGAKPELYQFLFSKGEYEMMGGLDGIMESDFLSEKQKKVIEGYSEIENSELKNVFKDVFEDGCEDYSIEGIGAIGGLLNQLVISNADEIAGHPVEFARMLLKGFDGDEKDLMDRYEKIEEIFVHNNLPYVGKVFNTFLAVFMDNKTWKGHFREVSRGDLGRATEEQKRGILWNDLLKASIGSGDKQLRDYLESLREGSILAEKVLSEDVPENEFSDDEIGILNEYAEHLDTLYSNTEQGRQEQEERVMSIFDKVRYYSLRISAEERREIPDIIVRNFASGLGFQSLEQLLGYMDRTVESADARNRDVARRGEFRLESGDLIKSVNVEFLGNLLQGGVVCKEFLNGEMPSDSTPLDADLGVMPVGVSGSISEMVEHKNKTNAFGAMHCMLVMKGDDNEGGRGRFKFEHEEGEYDPWKYEVWENGGENHGVRVGFPSTEIDYIVYDRINGDMYGDLERMKFEMVRSGLYIPVVDRYTEEVVFTPDDYDKMREERMGGLEEYSDAPYRFADERGVVDGFSLPEYRIGETVIPSTTELVEGTFRNREEVDEKRGAIIGQVILPVLEEFGLRFEDEISSNLFKGRAEVIDTGSTGRYSNAPHDGDFDFMMKLDKEIKDGARLNEIRNALLDRMNLTPEQRASAVQNGNIRATDVKIEGLDELVDIDVTFARRTAKVDYSTDMALNEYYEAMREQSPEKAAEVVANVVYAKKLLKANGVYKPSRRDSNQGGLGGVGIENWVIQNGGSFEAAARSFMRVADECGDNFDLFKEKYSVFDFGENHKMDAKAAHDNFVVGNMNAVGYGKMKTALREFLDRLDSSR